MRIKLTVCILLLFGLPAIAQQNYLSLNHDLVRSYDTYLTGTGVDFHTAVKPYLQSEVDHWLNLDSITNKNLGLDEFILKRNNSWIWRKIVKEHLLDIEQDDYSLFLSPLYNLNIGNDLVESKGTYMNSRGIWIGGNLGKHFSFSTDYFENEAIFPEYIVSFINNSTVVPGKGKVRKLKSGAYDYANASGYISYSAPKYFNFQLGNGKNFIGDGYRSLLLSDNAFNYPFLKITTTFWRIKYMNLYTQYQDIRFRNPATKRYFSKNSSTHFLDVKILDRLYIGLYESVVWQSSDSLGTRGFEFNYLNPIIFYHPLNFSIGSPDNVLIGTNIRYKISNTIVAYGQFLLDDFNFSEYKKKNGFYQQKVGFQLGFKAYDVFRIPGLFFQTEYNQVQPYTYAHKFTTQNYAHFNQALAHPLGANFMEIITFISYQRRRLGVNIQFLRAVYGIDADSIHNGKNIYRSDFDIPNFPNSVGNSVRQGTKTNLTYYNINLSYLINPKTNLKFEVGFASRLEESSKLFRNQSNYIFAGIRTNLKNTYFDF